MAKPFDNLSQNQIGKLFDLLLVHTYKYNKNQEIIPTIKKENIIGIITSGYAQIIQIDYNGNEIIIEELTPNSVFGTNMSGTNNETYQIIAQDDTEVVIIDYSRIIDPNNLKYNYYNVFIRNLFDIINIKYRRSTERIRILEQKQIRDKLLEVFEIEYKKTGARTIYLTFTFKTSL